MTFQIREHSRSACLSGRAVTEMTLKFLKDKKGHLSKHQFRKSIESVALWLHKDVVTLEGKCVGNYIFALGTFEFLGLNVFLIDLLYTKMYPCKNTITNTRIRNIGNHWIREKVDMNTTTIFDSNLKIGCHLCNKSYKWADCPQQVHEYTCGLYALYCEFFGKLGLAITQNCLKIEDPHQALHDLCFTYFWGKISEDELKAKYYRPPTPALIPTAMPVSKENDRPLKGPTMVEMNRGDVEVLIPLEE